MKLLSVIGSSVLVLPLAFGLGACAQQGPKENAGNKEDAVVNSVGKAMSNIGGAISDTIDTDKVVNSAGKAMSNVGAAISDTIDSAEDKMEDTND